MRTLSSALSLCLLLLPVVSAEHVITTSALAECQSSSSLSVTYFNAQLSKDGTLSLAFDGYSYISGDVTAEIHLLVYGYLFLNKTIHFCDLGLSSLCPLSPGALDVPSASVDISSILSDIPG